MKAAASRPAAANQESSSHSSLAAADADMPVAVSESGGDIDYSCTQWSRPPTITTTTTRADMCLAH